MLKPKPTPLSRVASVPEQDAASSSCKRGKKKRPAVAAMDLSYLDAAVTKMLERLGAGHADIDTPSSMGSRNSGSNYLGAGDSLWDRRDRSSSLPCPPRPGELSMMLKSSSQNNKAKSPGAATPTHRAAAVRDLASLVT
eukprot:3488647-Rhodomonas_salina.1